MLYSGYTSYTHPQGFTKNMDIPIGGFHFMAKEAAIVSAASRYRRTDPRRLDISLTKAIVSYKNPFVIEQEDPLLDWEKLSQKKENQGYDAILYPTRIGRTTSNCLVVWETSQIRIIDAHHRLTIH